MCGNTWSKIQEKFLSVLMLIFNWFIVITNEIHIVLFWRYCDFIIE